MPGTVIKCIIARYDETIKSPPFLTIPIDKIEVIQPETDHLGEELFIRLNAACISRGYNFKFYTFSKDPNFEYKIVVY